ncbi:peroxiredoxin [Bowmanella dokdonensis]|uniref:Glutathione-dependent peroxiredoxin n=1 Tax=Bowmanella dokdonensis TaxID=751969 RepID=A0A939DMU0_9ALTE|nr:peroxiredoxin [Bowmanella dokdonensis]MBN7825678.1 peroxiredoxin [Bowmanella dokdonensis]
MIKPGQALPQAILTERKDGQSLQHTTAELFKDKTVVLFAVPGAFTPTCSNSHLPGYVALADKIKAKGVDSILCVSVNDAFVMQAWGQAHNADEIRMLGDGDGSFTIALGLDKDTGSFGGTRSMRYSMLVRDGVVDKLNLEVSGKFEVSDAQTLLDQLG